VHLDRVRVRIGMRVRVRVRVWVRVTDMIRVSNEDLFNKPLCV